MNQQNQTEMQAYDAIDSAELPANGRMFLLRIQQQDGQLQGSIHNLYLEEPQSFSSIADAILRMDAIMDGLNSPQAATKARTFQNKKEGKNDNWEQREAYQRWLEDERQIVRQYWHPKSFQPQLEEGGLFYIYVRFRQHSSWQGDILWKRGGKKEQFRSVLELLHLVQSAFNSEEEA